MADLVPVGGGLPLVFFFLLYGAVFLYVILDGYDLGVGMLFAATQDADEREQMIHAIGPFWDANETWLVLGVGILLAAFPVAHGMILGMLYLPVAMMLSGLMLRGAAFEFRVKAPIRHRRWWDGAFCGASLLAAVSQGVMLGRYVTGFSEAAWAWPFALGVGLALPAGYALLGAAWLIMKTTGEIRRRAVGWGRRSLRGTALGMAAISLATLMCLPDVAAKWLAMPMPIGLAPLPLATLVLIAVLEWSLRCLSRPPASGEEGEGCPEWLPFFAAVGLFGLGFAGLAYSLFPSLVAGRLDLWQAAGSPASLRFLLAGVALVLPFIVFYTVYVHWVFRGKLTAGPYQDRSAPLL